MKRGHGFTGLQSMAAVRIAGGTSMLLAPHRAGQMLGFHGTPFRRVFQLQVLIDAALAYAALIAKDPEIQRRVWQANLVADLEFGLVFVWLAARRHGRTRMLDLTGAGAMAAGMRYSFVQARTLQP